LPVQHELLIDLLQEVNKGLSSYVREVLAGHRIPVATMVVMRKIKEEPGTTVSELARRTGFAKSNVSSIIEDLSRRGLVEKRTDPADHRLLRLHHTEPATGFLSMVKADIRGRIGDLVSGIPETRKAELIEGLREIREALKKAKEKEQKR